jgi:hypothetical protein
LEQKVAKVTEKAERDWRGMRLATQIRQGNLRGVA